MAASDPEGGQQFWADGAPVAFVRKSGNDTDGLKFWADGAPVAFLLPPVGTPVYMRPDADSATDNWLDELGGSTDIYQSIDEASPADDDDYVISPAAPSQADLIVRLMEGTTEIVEWTHLNIGDTFVTATQTLTTPQFESITDFDNLFIELDDNQGNVYKVRLSNPSSAVQEPFKVRYRYKRVEA